MFWLWEQSAWVRSGIRSYSSETQTLSGSSNLLSFASNDQGLEDKRGKSDKEWFYQWLVGLTDGDGCFNIYVNLKKNKITLTFKISLKANNIQVLHYIKKQLGVGTVRSDKQGMAHFLIRDKRSIETILIPIFDTYSLLTNKEFSYLKFKRSLEVWNSEMSQADKASIIHAIHLEPLPANYVSSSWLTGTNPISKPWLVGFIEAEGSFYLTLKEEGRLAHGFGLTQKLDKIVLVGIRTVLKIEANVKWNSKGFWGLDSTNSNSLKVIKDYFFKTMKSRKALEFRVWSRSFRHKGQYEKLLKIKELIDKIRNSD